MAYGLSNGHVTDTRRCCEAVQLAILATAWLLVVLCEIMCKNLELPMLRSLYRQHLSGTSV